MCTVRGKVDFSAFISVLVDFRVTSENTIRSYPLNLCARDREVFFKLHAALRKSSKCVVKVAK
jgi:hypothetical protein